MELSEYIEEKLKDLENQGVYAVNSFRLREWLREYEDEIIDELPTKFTSPTFNREYVDLANKVLADKCECHYPIIMDNETNRCKKCGLIRE